MQRLRRALEAAFPDDGRQCGECGVVEHGFSSASSRLVRLVCLHSIRGWQARRTMNPASHCFSRLPGVRPGPGPELRAHRRDRRAERLRAAPGPAPRARGQRGAVLRGGRRACSSRRASWAWRRPWGRARAWRAPWPWRAPRSWRSTAGGRCGAHGRPTGWMRRLPVRRCRWRSGGAGGRLHAAQSACLPGHRAAGGQHRRPAAGGASGLVHRRGQPAPAWSGSRCWASARVGWRPGLRGRGPGRCSTA